ncbi:MAG: FkbM family methyltransferase [Pirellulales bacterium]
MLANQIKHSFRHFRFRCMGLKPQEPCQVAWGDRRYGWPICPEFVHANSVVYSFGVGADVVWDTAMIRQFGTQVYAFDPTPEAIEWVRSRKNRPEFHFFDFGIASFDGVLQFYPPKAPGRMHFSQDRQKFNWPNQPTVPGKVHRLSTIMKMLGHTRIDVLKMDVEGTEFECLPEILDTGVEIDQLLIEIHYNSPTRSWAEARRLLRRLMDTGFTCFNISPRGLEFSFVHQRLLASSSSRVAAPARITALAG